MKIFRKSIFFSLLFYCSFFYSCTSVKLRNANVYYEEMAFADAIKNFEAVLSKRMIPDAAIKLADCYRQTGNSAKAELWYSQVVKFPESLPVHKLYYGEALMENGKYAEAKTWFNNYLKIVTNDERAKNLLQSCDSTNVFFADTTQYEVTPIALNISNTNNFSPTWYRSGIVFVSDRTAPGKRKVKSNYTGMQFLDLFYVKKTDKGNWLEPELLRGNINGGFNEGPAVFSKDFNVVYFTRNDYTENKVNKNKKSYNNLKIYKGTFTGGEWNISSDLPFNNQEYSTGHPSISGDGVSLYFVSDMPWGYGGSDIYQVKYINGRWNNPQNLGAGINTSGNELFPFIYKDSVLFYSSDGYYGLGGLDVFEAVYKNEKWASPFNIGYPVNSSKDDFGFIIDSSGSSGFFSSNRNDGFDKIYSFVKNPPKITVTGIVSESGTNSLLQKVRVTLKQEGQKDTSIYTGADGRFLFTLGASNEYDLVFQKEMYFYKNELISTYGISRSISYFKNISLNKAKINQSDRYYSISFEKGNAKLKTSSLTVLDSLATVYKNNPSIKIEISCHTDARGADKDNLTLTQNRAETIADYLSLKGIAPRRISGKGMGELKLLNKCVNGVLCLEEDHQMNVRTEIKIVSAQ